MDDLRPLVDLLGLTDRSELARVLRSGLVGLRACLGEAASLRPGDAGAGQAVELLDALGRLLGDRPAPDGPGDRPGGLRDRVSNLAARFASDQAVAAHLDRASITRFAAAAGGPPGVRRGGDEPPDAADLWWTLHLRLLRLPAPLAAGWRDRAAALAADTAPGVAPVWTSLPAAADAVLIPPLLAGGPALRTSTQAPCDPQVTTVLDVPDAGAAAERSALARLVSMLLTLTEVDDQLRTCLTSVVFQGARRLSPDVRRRYRAELLSRSQGFGRAGPGSVDALMALVEVDEAVHSLLHVVPAAPSSWWSTTCALTRRLLAEHTSRLREAGGDVETAPLTGLRYRELGNQSANDLPVDIGGTPGSVVTCLRVFARVGDRAMPGRVVYHT